MTSPASPSPLIAELSTLEASCTGRILRAGDARVATYADGLDDLDDLGRGLVVLADCVHDVGAAVRFARRAGVATAVVGGVHPTGAIPADAVVIVVSGICRVDVDPDDASARLGVGAPWSAVHHAVAVLGLDASALAPEHGSVGATLAHAIAGAADGEGSAAGAPDQIGATRVLDAVIGAHVVDATGRARFRADRAGADLLDVAHQEGQIITAVDLRLR